MLKLNEPIRIVCKDDDIYDFVVTRESKKIEGNEEILKFITFLRTKENFTRNIIDEYIDKNNILNKEEYYDCFDVFIDNNIITEY